MQEAEQSISNMVSSLDLFEELVVDLQPEQWTVQSLCPDWTVKGVVEHIVGIERILIDWRPTSAESPPSIRSNRILPGRGRQPQPT